MTVAIIADTAKRAAELGLELGIGDTYSIGKRSVRDAGRGWVSIDAVLIDDSAPTVGADQIAESLIWALKPGARVYRLSVVQVNVTPNQGVEP